MIKRTAVIAIFALSAAPAFAAGDPAKGEAVFKQCQTCHTITDTSGNTIAGRGAKVGPNLYGVVGRTAGTYDGFRYGRSIVEAGEKGLVWDEETIAVYVQDPSGFLKSYLDDNKARGKMTYKVRKPDDAENVAAYLKSVGPAPGGSTTN